MNPSKRILFFAAALASLAFSGQAQSGWTRPKNGFFGKLDWSHLASKTYFNPVGDELATAEFRQSSLNLYAEYGLRPRLTLIAHAPLLRLNRFETTETVAGFGDLRLEAKYRLTKNSSAWPIAVSIAPELPTGRRNAFAKNKTSPAERINLPTGDGEFNVWTTLAASKSLGKTYVSVFGAYNFRTKFEGLAFRDQYQFGIEGGWNPVPALWLNANLRAQFATGESRHAALGFVRGDGTAYTLAVAEAFWKINKNWGLAGTFLTGGGGVAPLRNIYVAPYFSVGIVYQRG